jgi:hypothetical protein
VEQVILEIQVIQELPEEVLVGVEAAAQEAQVHHGRQAVQVEPDTDHHSWQRRPVGR